MGFEQTIAHYRVTGKLGEGGKGEVYRATGTKLGRDVALKILPESFAEDPERMARFEREANVLASLNHPNIAQIYGIEQRALVIELVEGETLKGPLPVQNALNYARQIAEALEAAHEKGIIHRDLKPANIMITPVGTVKVLDFGLAKAADETASSGDPTNSPTLTISPTRAGMILGTAAYMSPEQARGKTVDRRADIWAFGVVLYEMFTGKQMFTGETVTDILASVVKERPQLDSLPGRVRMVVERCLQKDPQQRWQAIGDVRLLIEGFLAHPGNPIEAEEQFAKKPLWKRVLPVASAAIVASAITAGLAVWALRPAAPASIVRFSVNLAGQPFTNTGRRDVAISPDGTEIAYIANRQLYLRRMAELEARPISGGQDPVGVANVEFAPDGQSIAYWAASERALKRIALAGGATTICHTAQNPIGISWGAGGIVYGQATQGIFRVSADGGNPELLSAVKKDEVLGFPQVLPGGQAVLFSIWHGTDLQSGQVVAENLKSKVRKTLIPEGSDARYLPTGHLVYALVGSLYAVPFDARRLEVSGAAFPVVEGVKRGAGVSSVAQFDISAAGSMIYIPGPVTPASHQYFLTLLSTKGDLEQLKLPPGGYDFPRVSRDGKRVAFELGGGRASDIWIYELSGSNAPRRLTFQGSNHAPVWSADGERVAFESNREGDEAIFWQRADGTGTAERLTRPEQGVIHIPDSFSPDGQQISFTARSNNNSSIWTFAFSDRRATLFADGGSLFAEDSTFSPDGRWLAYSTDTTGGGGDVLYVQPFPLAPGKYQIANGHAAVWSSDGKQLIFDAGPRKFAAVKVTTTGGFAFSNPTPLPDKLLGSPSGPRRYDILPDGRTIGIVAADAVQTDGHEVQQVQVVLNWFEELKQRVPAR